MLALGSGGRGRWGWFSFSFLVLYMSLIVDSALNLSFTYWSALEIVAAEVWFAVSVLVSVRGCILIFSPFVLNLSCLTVLAAGAPREISAGCRVAGAEFFASGIGHSSSLLQSLDLMFFLSFEYLNICAGCPGWNSLEKFTLLTLTFHNCKFRPNSRCLSPLE